jgi:hypothetical protein
MTCSRQAASFGNRLKNSRIVSLLVSSPLGHCSAAFISHEALAAALGVSIATVRQARLGEHAKAHRTPPHGWEAAIARLARQKADHFRRLAERLA